MPRLDPITIQHCTRTPDAAGEIVETWSTLHSTWAPVEPITGREHSLATAQQNLAEVTYSAIVRSDPLVDQVTATMRILWYTRTLYIAAVLRGSTPGEVKLLLQERPPV